jgi:hypothetical protein
MLETRGKTPAEFIVRKKNTFSVDTDESRSQKTVGKELDESF